VKEAKLTFRLHTLRWPFGNGLRVGRHARRGRTLLSGTDIARRPAMVIAPSREVCRGDVVELPRIEAEPYFGALRFHLGLKPARALAVDFAPRRWESVRLREGPETAVEDRGDGAESTPSVNPSNSGEAGLGWTPGGPGSRFRPQDASRSSSHKAPSPVK
jgi:hypothetical protein